MQFPIDTCFEMYIEKSNKIESAGCSFPGGNFPIYPDYEQPEITQEKLTDKEATDTGKKSWHIKVKKRKSDLWTN